MGAPQTGEVGGGLTNDMFRTAAQNDLIGPMDLSQATIAGQMGGPGSGSGSSGGMMAHLPSILQKVGKGINAAPQPGGGKKKQGVEDIQTGLQALSILASLYQ